MELVDLIVTQVITQVMYLDSSKPVSTLGKKIIDKNVVSGFEHFKLKKKITAHYFMIAWQLLQKTRKNRTHSPGGDSDRIQLRLS